MKLGSPKVSTGWLTVSLNCRDPVVMYGCKSWTIKKAECQKIDAFKLWCWRRLLRVPWTARKSNRSILKGISPEYSLEGPMLMLKANTLATWCKELTHLKRPWCWERLKAGGEGDERGWDGWMASPTQWNWVWVSSRSWWWTGKPGMLQSMGLQSRTWLSDWTELSREKNSWKSIVMLRQQGKEHAKDTDRWIETLWYHLVSYTTKTYQNHQTIVQESLHQGLEMLLD